MKLLKSLSLVGLLVSSVSVFAAVPYTFTNGTPANASEINANFAALQAQIDALQAGPTMASLAGTYKLYEMATEATDGGAGSYSIQSETGVGTVTLNADGTGSCNCSNNSTNLSFSNGSPVTVLTGLNVQNGSFITGVYPAMGTVQSQQVVTSVGTSSNTAVSAVIQNTYDLSNVNVSFGSNANPPGNDPLTWSLSGNTVTINAENALTFSIAGKILVGADTNGINILVRQ